MSKIERLLAKLRGILPEDAGCADESSKTGVVFAARVLPEKLRDAAKSCNTEGFFLESMTGFDFKDTGEVVYHFNCYDPKSRIALRTLCPHGEGLPSVSDIFASALWQEREVHEFFGITFSGHPDLKRLLLPEDADYYPLKKEFTVVHAYRNREEIYG
jgi:NADH-quinone oxidoreductase subunit C